MGFLVLIGAQFGTGAFVGLSVGQRVGLSVGQRVGFLVGEQPLWSARLSPSSLNRSEW